MRAVHINKDDPVVTHSRAQKQRISHPKRGAVQSTAALGIGRDAAESDVTGTMTYGKFISA